MSEGSEAPFHAEAHDDLVRLEGRGFGAVFRRVGDRWTDSVLRPGTGEEVAHSLAAPAADGDPARVGHPVYQEVHLHGGAGGTSLCLLLTGLSDQHHFSAAVTLSIAPDDPSTILLDFDIADRCRSAVERLAATYVVGLDSGALLSADPQKIAWSIGAPIPGRLEVLVGEGQSLALAEAGRQATRVQILAAIQAGTYTHRLRYGWRWTTAEPRTR